MRYGGAGAGGEPAVLPSLSVVLAALSVGCGGEPTAGARDADSDAWFTDVAAERGLDFVYFSGARGELHMPEMAGAGVGLFDCDEDGDLDCYFTNGNSLLPRGAVDPGHENRLFVQEEGRFRDATEESGLGDGGFGMGVAIGDVDNDGDIDVFLTNYGPDRLYRSAGRGRFADATDQLGIAVDGWSSSAAFVDYDRDGFLDLYVVRYLEFDPSHRCFDPAGRRDYCGPREFPPLHDVLLHNEGGRRLADVSERAGMAAVSAAGLGIVCEDFDDDGWPDAYVANDGYANQLWSNQKDGTFRDDAVVRGAAVNMNGQPEAGMGVVAADFDQDGRMDLFMTHLRQETNTLYLARPDGRGFVDASGTSGLGAPSMAFTGFGTIAEDFDLDGDVDIAIANGAVLRHAPHGKASVVAEWKGYAEPNLLFENLGAARFRAFDDETAPLDPFVEVSRGMAAGDVDGDGDVDLLLGNVESPARLLRNDVGRGHWLAVRCVDPALRRDALGARVELVLASGARHRRTVRSACSYQSASPLVAWFGLGADERIERLDVRWPDGSAERFTLTGVDRTVELRRGEGRAR